MSNTDGAREGSGGAIRHVSSLGYLDDEAAHDVNSNLDEPYSLIRDVTSGGLHIVAWPEDVEAMDDE